MKFGEGLPPAEIERATVESKKADLALVIGTSMRVKPACELPLLTAQNGGDLVIVNLQRTPFDSQSGPRVFGECDDFLVLVAKELGVLVPFKTPEGRELVEFHDDVDYRYSQEVERLQLKQSEYAPNRTESFVGVRLFLMTCVSCAGMTRKCKFSAPKKSTTLLFLRAM